jgi:sterol desaturase/sphingolipid hydroxylase (fatty acid hydroxylase superfamily)
MKHIYTIHHIGHHSVIFPTERYVTNGPVKRHPIFEKDVTKLGNTESSNFLTRLSHSGSYMLLTCMTIIGPSWLVTHNNILLISIIIATIIICDVVVTVHDAIHYPLQHPRMQKQKWFQFLDNHHFIHHIDTEKNVNFLLPICDFLFGTIKLSLSVEKKRVYGTFNLAKQNPMGYSEPAKYVLQKTIDI